MKKQPIAVLLAITGMLAAFTTGLFVGRNTGHENIQIVVKSTVPVYADKVPEYSVEETISAEKVISFPVDINHATLDELTALPGIGETLAQRILDYRTEHGNFSVPEELLNVSGIGAGKLEPILNLITAGG